jgi:CRISPR-associated Csx11 family protein
VSTLSYSQILRQHRPLLLACEAIGWLHMTGKAHPNFLRQHGGLPNDYEYKEWWSREKPPFPWSDLLQWVKDKYPLKPRAWPDSLTDFIKKHTESDSGLLGLLQAGHAMASGIEKNVPKATSRYLQQDVTHMWLTSPFGHPVRNLLADPPQLLTEQGWQALLCKIRKLLEGLQKLGNQNSNNLDGWWEWRESAIGPNGWLREAFLATLAETRLPNNDVTLWDQSYVAAALFKAAVAGAMLADRFFERQDKKVKQQTCWRVLTVGFGTQHYEARAVKIGDWAGARRDIDCFFKEVRRLIEVDLAVGSLVYQDEEALAFTFPDLPLDATGNDPNGSLDDKRAAELSKEIESEIDQLAEQFQFETPPLFQLSCSTRSFIPMVEELRKTRKELAIPVHRAWNIPNKNSAVNTGSGSIDHVCPVCQVRLNRPNVQDQTENARKSRVCSVCAERRRGRLNAWLNGESDTIWISEVADQNDRVALLTLSLDIEPWLGGKHLDSLRAQSIFEWRRFNQELDAQDSPIEISGTFTSLFNYVLNKLQEFDKHDPVLQSLHEGYGHATDWPNFFTKIVEDRSDAPGWGQLDDPKRSRWIVHQLFCKLPSPGRVYRFWRSAETFFDELCQQFREIAGGHENLWRTRRLLLYPDSGSTQSWEDRETYVGRFGNGPFELLYLEEKKAFLTITNLARCLDAAQERKVFKQALAIELRGEANQQVHQLRVTDVKTPEKIGAYSPIILLDRSPQRFRVLVPLECASACIEAAIEKWQEEFARVWDRLPLRIGVIAFPRLTPFQAVIEAARNAEVALAKQPEKVKEIWRVDKAQSRDGVTTILLERRDHRNELVTIPTRLPDGREDVFYPYTHVEDREPRLPHDFCHPDGEVFRRMNDLRPGDGVHVSPSLIAATFLDTTARRFEPVQVRYLSEFKRMRQLWCLLQDVAPSITALRGVWAKLKERQTNWQDPTGEWLPGAEQQWAELARVILADGLQPSEAALDTLVEAAVDSTLAWTLEWHLTWLKEDLGGRT